MSAATNYLENQIINQLFRTATMPKLTTIYLALFTTATDDTGGGTEVTGGAYARQAILVGDGSFTAPVSGNGVTTNVNSITFPFPTATWGTVTHFALFDAATGGNMLIQSALLSPVNIVSGGAPLIFVPNALEITVA